MDGPRPAAAPGSRDELVRRAAAGDVDAFARIIRLHHEAMTRAALVVTGDLDRAAAATDAALQDAWLALRHPRTPADLGSWLGGRAVVVAMQRMPEDGRPAHHPLPGLSPVEERAILALRDVVGLSTVDIAIVLHRPEGDIAHHLDRLPVDAASDATSVAEVVIRPIDADTVAHRARTEEVLERERRVSVAIGLVVGFLVAVHPYLVGLLVRR
jgi:hypothetical protein